MATVESYFESLGRQTSKPFLDEQNLYTETEPDLTKAVNENIDNEIKDTSQFFRDNIEMYKQLIKVRDDRIKNLFQLTKSGAPVVAAYAEQQDRLKKLDNLMSDETKIKFRDEGINFQELTGKNLLELNKELGTAQREIEQNGFYVTEGADGEEVRITTSKELNSYALMIAGLSTTNGRETAQHAVKYLPKFIQIAMQDMPHENGRYFQDLTLDEQVEWWRSLRAYYIGMWQQKDDRFSDGLVVNMLIPAFDKVEESFYSQILQQDDDATKVVLSEGNYKEGLSTIITQGTNILSNESYTASENKVIDGFWGENGYYQKRLAYWTEYHDGNKEQALESLDQELRQILKRGIESGELQSDVLDAVFTEWTFANKDGSGMTTFMDLNTRSRNLVSYIDNLLDAKTQSLNIDTLENKLQTYEANLDENIYMTQDQFNEYIPYAGSHPDLYKNALAIFEKGQRGGMESNEFAVVDDLLQGAISEYVTENQEKFGITKDANNIDRLIISTVSALTPAINRKYFEYYQGYLDKFENVEDAKNKALELVIADIEAGKFTSAIQSLADSNYEFKDVEQLGDGYADMIDKDSEGWVTTNTAHEGEMPHLLIGRKSLLDGGPMPAIYRQLAKLYPDLTAENLLYERLVAVGLIDPNDPKFSMYGLRLIAETNIQNSRLLTHFPTMTRALEFASLNAEQWATETTKLHVPEALEHFDGYGAFKAENGDYSTDINLTTMPLYSEETEGTEDLDSIAELLADNPNAEFGIYGMKGSDLSLVLKYLADNKLITGNEVFDDKFQLKLLMTKIKLNQNGQLAFTGDASYLNLSTINEEDQAEFSRLVGEDGDNIPLFNRLEFLLPYIVRYRVNTEL